MEPIIFCNVFSLLYVDTVFMYVLLVKEHKQLAVPLALIYCLLFFIDALMEYTKGEFAVTGANATANIFASYPAKHLSVLNGFLDQVGLKTNFKFLLKIYYYIHI